MKVMFSKFMLVCLLLVLVLSACEGVAGHHVENSENIATQNDEDPYARNKTYKGEFEIDTECTEDKRITYGEHLDECRCDSLRSSADWVMTSVFLGRPCDKQNYAGYGCFIDINTGELFGEKCNHRLYWERTK